MARETMQRHNDDAAPDQPPDVGRTPGGSGTVYEILSNRTRRKTIAYLAARDSDGYVTATEIAENIGVSVPPVYQTALPTLARFDIVKVEYGPCRAKPGPAFPVVETTLRDADRAVYQHTHPVTRVRRAVLQIAERITP